MLKNVPNGRGMGFFYWEPGWTAVPGGAWDPTDPSSGNGWGKQALFDYAREASGRCPRAGPCSSPARSPRRVRNLSADRPMCSPMTAERTTTSKKYRCRPNFAFSVFVSLVLILGSFSAGLHEVYASPWTWTAIGCLLSLPPLWATSKTLFLFEGGLCVEDLWGLLRQRVAWTDIEEAQELRVAPTEGGLYGAMKPFSVTTWLADRFYAADLKIFHSEGPPIYLRLAQWKGGAEVLDVIRRNVKMTRR